MATPLLLEDGYMRRQGCCGLQGRQDVGILGTLAARIDADDTQRFWWIPARSAVISGLAWTIPECGITETHERGRDEARRHG